MKDLKESEKVMNVKQLIFLMVLKNIFMKFNIMLNDFSTS